jgi:uncharacterized membrane protein
MASLTQAKNLGGVGAILTLLAIVPYAGTVLVIVGWILVLVAVKNISDAVQDKSIFNNALIAVVLAIVGAVVGGIVIGVNIFRYLGAAGTHMPTTINSTTVSSASFTGLITGVIAGLSVIWILGIIASYFLWRSFGTVSTKVNVGMFRTGGLLYFIGSILTIILVGFVLTFIAQILFIIAFFSLPETVPATVGYVPPPPSTGPSTPAPTSTPQYFRPKS